MAFLAVEDLREGKYLQNSFITQQGNVTPETAAPGLRKQNRDENLSESDIPTFFRENGSISTNSKNIHNKQYL